MCVCRAATPRTVCRVLQVCNCVGCRRFVLCGPSDASHTPRIHPHTWVRAHARTPKHVLSVLTLTHTTTPAYTRAHTYTRTHVHTHAHAHARTHTHTHAHARTHAHSQKPTQPSADLVWPWWLLIRAGYLRYPSSTSTTTCDDCPARWYCDSYGLTAPTGVCVAGPGAGCSARGASPNGTVCRPGEVVVNASSSALYTGPWYMYCANNCPAGSYCIEGVIRTCPPGTYSPGVCACYEMCCTASLVTAGRVHARAALPSLYEHRMSLLAPCYRLHGVRLSGLSSGPVQPRTRLVRMQCLPRRLRVPLWHRDTRAVPVRTVRSSIQRHVYAMPRRLVQLPRRIGQLLRHVSPGVFLSDGVAVARSLPAWQVLRPRGPGGVCAVPCRSLRRLSRCILCDLHRRLHCRQLLVSERLHQRNCDAVSAGVLLSGGDPGRLYRWSILRRRRECVQQLHRRLRVSRRLELVDTSSRDVSGRHLQHIRRDVVHQLQRRLRVPCRIDLVDAGVCDVSRGEVQRLWCDVVRRLQRRLRVPGCVDDVNTSGGDVSGGTIQLRRRVRMQ